MGKDSVETSHPPLQTLEAHYWQTCSRQNYMKSSAVDNSEISNKNEITRQNVNNCKVVLLVIVKKYM